MKRLEWLMKLLKVNDGVSVVKAHDNIVRYLNDKIKYPDVDDCQEDGECGCKYMDEETPCENHNNGYISAILNVKKELDL